GGPRRARRRRASGARRGRPRRTRPAAPRRRSRRRAGGSRRGSFAQQREAEGLALREVGLADGAREVADAADVALALGHADRAARVEHVEVVAALHDAVVGRQDEALLRVLFVEDERAALALLVG